MNSTKMVFICSVVLNICFGTFLFLAWQSNSINFQETKRIDQMRLDDLKLLEPLLINRISKDEVLTILKTTLPQNQYFEKPEENGIGLGSMFLEFDNNSKLQKITSPSQEGP